MASHGHGHAMPSTAPAQHGAPAPVVPGAAPVSTFVSGTKIQVGSHRVVIQKYLSEGGFAHVYLVKLPSPVNGTDQAVLKRVAVPDKEALRGMRIEVETMKRLKGHRPIVTYIDSHASELRGGGYEVFLLMEYCNGGGLIDFMNTRLQHRLTEPEILQIFTDITEGVACMHYLKPPLLHRDLKVENVLITARGSSKKFKLCDFGSAAPPRPAPDTVVECRLMDEDVQKHTTMQYRSPEMIDVYRKKPIDEKSDIWALGVLVYKLCYYTTPFEDQGQLAILNASYKFPSHPIFSDRLKKLIASMLKENQQSRPNVYQVLREACAMQGREVPIKDIYSGRSQSEPRSQAKAPSTEKPTSTPVLGAVFSPPPKQQQAIPEVIPMRRGRPTASQPQQHSKLNPSPMRVTNSDPFAALDVKANSKGDNDELSSRFPTLDQFSLLLDQGSKFDFDAPGSPPGTTSSNNDISQRVAERLADEAFVSGPTRPSPTPGSQRQSVEIPPTKPAVPKLQEANTSLYPAKAASASPKASGMSRASAIISSTPELQAISSGASQAYQTSPKRSTMVSTGTMTTTPPPERPQSTSQYQIHRFPPADSHRSSSLPRKAEPSGSGIPPRTDTPSSPWPGVPARVPSLQSPTGHVRQPSSSRPSLEGGRPSMDAMEALVKSKSVSNRPRPVSAHLESNMDFLRARETGPEPSRSPGFPSPKLVDTTPSPRLEPQDETSIDSNVDFLRSLEDSDPRKKVKAHCKRSSLSSLSGTKNILAGKFGDAFKRFEGNQSGAPARTHSPLKDLERRDLLTPIAGSEATDGRSDDGQVLDETDDMSPEIRREIERRRLSDEEKRVAAGAAEYRERVARREQTGKGPSSNTGPTPLPKSIGGVSRAQSIQNKVQSLLDESTRASFNVTRTAEGYGRYADNATVASRPADRPDIPHKPVTAARAAAPGSRPTNTTGSDMAARHGGPVPESPTSARPIHASGIGRPTAPPKPNYLKQDPTSNSVHAGSTPKPSSLNAALPVPPGATRGRSDQLVAVDLPGLHMTPQEKDDYLRDFSKRFPSLTAIEMVERDLAAESGQPRK